MQVDVKKLVDMLKFSMIKTKGSGDKLVSVIPDLLIIGKSNKAIVSAVSQSGIFYEVSIDAIVENETFPIAEIDSFIKMLSTVEGLIDLSFDGSKITIKSGKTKVRYNTCKTVISAKNLESYSSKIRNRTIDGIKYMGYGSADVVYQTKAVVKATEIKKIAKSGKILDCYDFNFKVIDGVFTLGLSNEDKGDMEHTPEATVIGPNAAGIYNTGVDVIFDYLKGDISFYMSTNRPMIIEDGEGNLVVLYPFGG